MEAAIVNMYSICHPYTCASTIAHIPKQDEGMKGEGGGERKRCN